MLELIMIALASTGIAVVAVWIYRKLSESRGANATLVSLSENRGSGSLRLSAQQGFVRLHSEPSVTNAVSRKSRSARRAAPKGHKAAARRSPSSNKDVRKPWGW